MRPLPCAAVSVRYSGGLNSLKHGTAFREGEPEIRHREGRLRHYPCEAQFPAPQSVLNRGCPLFPFPARGLKLIARSGTVCSITREATNGQPPFSLSFNRPGPGG